jgi:predicted outer membrane lipoprotein
MVIDASSRGKTPDDLASRLLSRQEVIGTPLAPQAFEIVDAIWLGDSRISEITEQKN